MGEPLVLHVLCSPAIDGASDDLSREGRDNPMGGIASNYIHVAEQDNRAFRRGRGMGDTRPQIGAARSEFKCLIFNAFLVENLVQESGSANFIAWRVGGIYA